MAADQPDYTGSVYVTGGQVVIDTGGGPVTVQFSAPQQVEFPAAQDVNATILGTATVQFGTAQEVFFTTSGPVDVQNDYLSTGPLFEFADVLFTVNVGAGGSTYLDQLGTLGLYDQIQVFLYSPSGNAANYTLQFDESILTNPSGSAYAWTGASYNLPFTMRLQTGNLVRTDPLTLNPPAPGNELEIKITSSVAIDEQVRIIILVRYASAEVTNPSSNPAQMQHASGQFSFPAGFDTQPTAVGTAMTLCMTGQPYEHLQSLWLSIQGNGSSVNLVDLYIANDHVDQLYVPQSGFVRATYDLGYGIDISTTGVYMQSSVTAVTVAGGGAICAYAALAAPNIYYG